MIDLNRVSRTHLETEPYHWAGINELFSPEDAAALAATFPRDHFKRVADHVGEKQYEYEIRALIATTVSPLVGNSVVLVRSDNSWHAVAHVANNVASPGAA